MSGCGLVVVGPLPPPYHGVTVSTGLVLENPLLREVFEIRHVDTSDHRSSRNIGAWDLANVVGAVRALARLVAATRGGKGLVYLPLSQNTPGFLRDSLLVAVARARGWRVAAHLRGGEFRSYYDEAPRVLQRWIRSTVDRIDSVAVMGENLRWLFEGLLPEDRIAVVPNGTPDLLVDDVARDRRHVLFLSNLRRRKGVVEAVRAALLVLGHVPQARFTFAGTWESADVEREVRAIASAANGSITFLGPVEGDEKDRVLASAAVFLFTPVEPEGHPRVVLEALAAGLPVVATNRGAIAETVIDGVTGFVLENPEPHAIAAAIVRLLVEPELRVRQSESARARYLSLFTQERADARLARWLSGLADSH